MNGGAGGLSASAGTAASVAGAGSSSVANGGSPGVAGSPSPASSGATSLAGSNGSAGSVDVAEPSDGEAGCACDVTGNRPGRGRFGVLVGALVAGLGALRRRRSR